MYCQHHIPAEFHRHAKSHGSCTRLVHFQLTHAACTEIISLIYARFIQEIDIKLQLITTRRPVQA